MSLTSFMVHTCNVETQAQTKSATGGVTVYYVPKASALPCNVQQLSGEAQIKYGKEGYAVTHKVYFEADPDLTIKDRLLFSGEYYEVKGIDNVVHLDRLWVVLAEKKPHR